MPRVAGKADWMRFKKGEKLTRSGAIRAKCYDCTGGFADGPLDCEITTCPLYAFMPYRRKP